MGCFDWPAEISDGAQNTLDAKGESCQEHRGMFYLFSYIVFTLEGTEIAVTSSQLMSSLFKVITKTKGLVRMFTKEEICPVQ